MELLISFVFNTIVYLIYIFVIILVISTIYIEGSLLHKRSPKYYQFEKVDGKEASVKEHYKRKSMHKFYLYFIHTWRGRVILWTILVIISIFITSLILDIAKLLLI